MRTDFNEQIEQLREDITMAIIGLLHNHGLTEIELQAPDSNPDAPNPVYVIFFDNDGEPFECVVEKVRIDGGSLEITASDKDGRCRFRTESCFDLSSRSPIWLNEILLATQALLENKNINTKNT